MLTATTTDRYGVSLSQDFSITLQPSSQTQEQIFDSLLNDLALPSAAILARQMNSTIRNVLASYSFSSQ